MNIFFHFQRGTVQEQVSDSPATEKNINLKYQLTGLKAPQMHSQEVRTGFGWTFGPRIQKQSLRSLDSMLDDIKSVVSGGGCVWILYSYDSYDTVESLYKWKSCIENFSKNMWV